MGLCISRGPGESVHIGENIVVRVNRISLSNVQLDIVAPSDVKILREELLEPTPYEAPETGGASV
jgi:carbon storage regulator CsrA